jgi:hypothetical protein
MTELPLVHRAHLLLLNGMNGSGRREAASWDYDITCKTRLAAVTVLLARKVNHLMHDPLQLECLLSKN